MFEESLVAGDAAFQELFRSIELQAADALQTALADHRGEEPPAELAAARVRFEKQLRLSLQGPELLRRMDASDLDLSVLDDEDVLIAATAAWAYPEGGSADDEPAALECVDWLPVVAFLTTEGVGADAAPDRLAAMALTKHKLPQRPSIESEEFDALEAAFAEVLPIWELVGITEHHLVTDSGRWLLPRGFSMAWGVDFDDA